MKVAFIDNSRSLLDFKIKDYRMNPGIGGTEYVLTKIMVNLSVRKPEITFYLVTNQNVEVDERFQNIKVLKPSKKIYCDVVIVPTAHMEFYKNEVQIEAKRSYGWSHHPHDTVQFDKKSIDGMISIGDYQYQSNKIAFGHHYLIPNPYPLLSITNKKPLRTNKPLQFVYLGGVNPAKGLDKVLINWAKISQLLPDSQLTVIGGDLYNENLPMTNSTILVGGKFGKRLKTVYDKLSQDSQNRITFTGKINSRQVDQILTNADIALLNPTGKSEAAPASPIECGSYGVLTIAGGDFGMKDYMKNFPELDLKRNTIQKIIQTILNEEKTDILRIQTKNLAKRNEASNEKIYQTWIKLIEGERIKCPDGRGISIVITLRFVWFNLLKRFLRRVMS